MAEVIPTRSRQVGVAPSISPPRADASAAGSAIGRAVEGIGIAGEMLGKSLKNQADRIELQHDIATVQSRDNEFSEFSINKRQEYLDLRGEDAKGSQTKYKEWYRKESGSIILKLQNDRQRQFWSKIADSRLNADLSTLAKHQSTEHKRHLQGNVSASIASAQESAAQDPFNSQEMELYDEKIILNIAVANPGVDNTAAINKALESLRLVRLGSMTDKDPIQAEQYLKTWKEDLGAAYPAAKEIVTPQALFERARLLHPGDFTEQTKFVAAANDKDYSKKAKSYARNQIAMRRADSQMAENEQHEATQEAWFNAYQAENLDEAEVEASDLPVSTKNLWISKIKVQRNNRITQANSIRANKTAEEAERRRLNAESTRDQYAMALELVDLTPEMVTPAQIYSAVDPNGGGLTGEQATSLVSKLKKNLTDRGVKESIKSAKTKIKEMYNRGDFGDLGKKVLRANAKRIKADILIGLEEWMGDNLDKDPNEWLDSKLNLIAAEEVAGAMNTWFGGWLPGGTTPAQQRRLGPLIDSDDPFFTVKQYVMAQGVDPTSLPDEAFEALLQKKEFMDYRAGLLEKITGQ